MFYAVILCIEIILLLILSRFLTRSLSRLLFYVTKSQSITIQILAFFFLPGVVVHEVAHLIVASLLFVPTGEVEFMPQLMDGGVKLGSVAIGKTDPFRRALIGVAPFLFGMSFLVIAIFYFVSLLQKHEVVTWEIIALVYIFFEIGNTMFSSKKDLEGTIELFITIIVMGIAAYILGVRVPLSWIGNIFSNTIVSYIQTVDIFMFIPIIIDIVVWGFVRVVVRR